MKNNKKSKRIVMPLLASAVLGGIVLTTDVQSVKAVTEAVSSSKIIKLQDFAINKMERLQKEKSEQIKQISEVREEINSVKSEIQNSNEQLKNIIKERESVTEKLVLLEKEEDELATILSTTEQDKLEIEEQLATVQKKKEKLIELMNEAKNELTLLKDKLSKQKELLDEKEKEENKLGNKEKVSSIIENLEYTIKVNTPALSRAEQDLAVSAEKTERFEKQKDELNKIIKDEFSTSEDKAKAERELKIVLKNIRIQKNLPLVVKDYKRVIKQAREQLQRIKDQQLDENTNEIVKAIKDQIVDLQGKIVVKTNEITKKDNELKNLDNELKNKENQNKIHLKNNADEKQKLEEIKTKIAEIQACRDKYLKVENGLHEKLEELNLLLKTKTSLLQDSELKIETINKKIIQLKQEMEKAKEKHEVAKEVKVDEGQIPILKPEDQIKLNDHQFDIKYTFNCIINIFINKLKDSVVKNPKIENQKNVEIKLCKRGFYLKQNKKWQKISFRKLKTFITNKEIKTIGKATLKNHTKAYFYNQNGKKSKNRVKANRSYQLQRLRIINKKMMVKFVSSKQWVPVSCLNFK